MNRPAVSLDGGKFELNAGEREMEPGVGLYVGSGVSRYNGIFVARGRGVRGLYLECARQVTTERAD